MSKKRMTIRMGITVGNQVIEDDGTVSEDYIINNWGCSYSRLEPEEAVLFQEALNNEIGADMDALIAKARKVAVDFGLETIVGNPNKPEKAVR